MNVLLLNPGSARDLTAGAYSRSMSPMPPLGLAYLAAVARDAGARVRVEDQYASAITAAQVVDLAEAHQADVVGISCLSPNVPMVEQVVRRLKDRRPATHIVLGNVHATYFAEHLFREMPIDSIVLGEGEETFGELLRALQTGAPPASIRGLVWRRDGEPVRNAPRPLVDDLARLPRPAWDLLRVSDYLSPPRMMMRDRVLAVQATRGCPWKCSFCSQNIFSPVVRRRDLGAVVGEMAWIVRDLGVTCFGFQDAVFPLNEAHGLEFCRRLHDAGLHEKVRWFTETRPELVTRDLLAEMRRCGCAFIMYGFETASARLQQNVCKNADPTAARTAMRYMKELDFTAYGLFMIGFPHETEAEARATIRWAKELDCDVASFARVTPYPGTAMYEEYKHAFPARVPPWQWNNQYRPRAGEVVWQLPGLSPRRITRLLARAMIEFYLRPRLVWRHWRRGLFTPKDMVRGLYYVLKDGLSHLRQPTGGLNA
jgi:radical SAM superfamily enzyme YgiQ (UPF0313 family)